MSYEPNLVNKHDVIFIRDCEFESMSDFHPDKDKTVKLKFLRRRKPSYLFVDDLLADPPLIRPANKVDSI